MIAAQQASPREALSGKLRAALGLVVSLALLVGAVWLLEGGRLGEDAAGESTVITLAGGAGGVTPRVGEPAPVFSLESLDGGPLSLADLRGHPVLVNFWASWCPPCRGEMPDLEKLAQEYRSQRLIVLAVNLQEDREPVQRYADTLGLGSLTIVLDRQGAVANRYNLTALPTSYFVDKDGVVRDLNMGALTEKGLRAKLAKILG